MDNGENIIKTAIDNFGRIDVLINNAGILRDISFKNMKQQDWDLIMTVHVRGAYKCARAAWPYFRKQKYGRLISTASAAGLFGSFGQCNYSGMQDIDTAATRPMLTVYSRQARPCRLYRNACKGGFEIQHPLQRHRSHRC